MKEQNQIEIYQANNGSTQFIKWANTVLKNYLVKIYALNKKRLTQKEQEIKLLQRSNILIEYITFNLSSRGAIQY